MKNNFKRCLALILAIMTIVGSFAIPVAAADECTHNWEMKDKKDPTCTTQGYESWFCTECQKYEIRNLVARLEHEFVFVVAAKAPTCSDGGHPANSYVCKNGCGAFKCDEAYDKDYYTKKPAIPTESEFGDPNKDFHKWGTPVVEGNSCTSDKYVTTYTCELCNKDYVSSKANTPEGHNFGTVEVNTDPTCVAYGEGVRKCKDCDFSEKVIIAKIAHDYSTDEKDLKWESKEFAVNSKDAGLGKTYGHRAFWVCRAEGCSERKYAPGLGGKDDKIAASGYVACNNGDNTGLLNDGWVRVGDAASTCSYRATYTRTCEDCGSVQTREEWNQPAHVANEDAYIAVVESEHTNTKVVDGYKVYICVNCGEEFRRYDGWKTSGVTPNVERFDDKCYGRPERWVPGNTNDHKWIKNGSAVGATCTTAGVQMWKCSVSGCIATKATTDKVAHVKSSTQYIELPTCTTNGSVYYKCERCDTKLDVKVLNKFGTKHGSTVDAGAGKAATVAANYKKKLEAVTKTVALKDQAAYKALTIDAAFILEAQEEMGYVASNCLTTGVTFKVCQDCNAKVGADSSLKKLTGHNIFNGADYEEFYGTGCYEDKYYIRSCDVCDVSEKVVVLKAAGAHDFTGDLVSFQTATCYSKGIEGRVCQREGCSAKVEEKIIDFDIDNHPNAANQVPSGSVAGNINSNSADGTWPAPGYYSCYETTYEWVYCKDCHRNYRRAYTVDVTKAAIEAKIAGLGVTSIYYNGKNYDVATYQDGDIKVSGGKHAEFYAMTSVTSCHTNGKGIKMCLKCDLEPVKDAAVPKLAHVAVSDANGVVKYVYGTDTVVTAASCAGDITWGTRCAVCKIWMNTGVLKAVAHSYVNVDPITGVKTPVKFDTYSKVEIEGVEVELRETCVKEGQKERACVNCGFKQYQTVAKKSKHIVDANSVVEAGYAATCLTTGLAKTYKCTEEGCGVLFTVADAGTSKEKHTVVKAPTVIAATGHSNYKTYVESKAGSDGQKKNPIIVGPYVEVAKCEGFTGNIVYCGKPGCTGYSADETITEDDGKFVIGFANYAVYRDHEIVADAERITVAATCATWEYTYLPCKHCDAHLDKVDNKLVPKAPHLNKDGNVLTGSCLLILGDVNCEKCKGTGIDCAICAEAYECVNAIAWDEDGVPTDHCEDVILPKCQYTEEKFTKCNVVKKTCTVCADVVWDPEDDGNSKVYHNYVVKSEPTIKTEGVEACDVCGYENPNKVPKLAAVVFDLKAYNPLDPEGSIVNGGKVYVKISMKALEDIEVNGIRVALKYNTDDLIFVGAVDNTSVFGEFAQAHAKEGIAIVFDDAGKERYNVTIEGEKEVEYTTLEFYVKPDAFDESDRRPSIVSFATDDEIKAVKAEEWASCVVYYDVEASTEKEDVYSDYAFDITTNNRIDLKIDQLGDYSNNGKINATDLAAVRDRMIDILNKVEGAEYDAVLDIDHNGVIDMDDYGFIKEFMVRKYEHWQFGDIISYNEWLADLAADKNNVIKPDNYDKYVEWLEDVKAN